MKEALSRIIAAGRWELPLFGGSVHVRGRILSPAEAEAAGLATYLLMSQLADPRELARVAKLQKRAEEIQSGEGSQDEMEEFIGLAGKLGINPDALAKMAEGQDRLICQVVKSASIDGGQTWERLAMVPQEDQQDAEAGRRWIGMLSKEDRETILAKALEGHREASERIAGFLGSGS